MNERKAIQNIFEADLNPRDKSLCEELNEASQVDFDDLNDAEKKTLFAIMKITGASRGTRSKAPTDVTLFGGIHGRIAWFKHGMGTWGGPVPRLFMDDLKKVVKLKIRWIEFAQHQLTVGF